MTNPRIGGSFDSFLEENDIREEVDALAQKRVLAWQIEQQPEACAQTDDEEEHEDRGAGI